MPCKSGYVCVSKASPWAARVKRFLKGTSEILVTKGEMLADTSNGKETGIVLTCTLNNTGK